jgi:hypothetical protein
MVSIDPTAAAVLLAKRIVQHAEQRGAARDRDQAESIRTSVGTKLCPAVSPIVHATQTPTQKQCECCPIDNMSFGMTFESQLLAVGAAVS